MRRYLDETLRFEVREGEGVLDLYSLTLDELHKELGIKQVNHDRLPSDWREVDCQDWFEVKALLNDLRKDTLVMNNIYGYEIMNLPYEPIRVYYTVRHSFS